MTRRAAWVGGACAVLVICTFWAPAFAQSDSFRNVDTNSDRVLSRDELVTAFGARGAARLLSQSDSNGDGKLTIQELRQGSRSAGEGGDADRNDKDDGDDDDGGGDDNGSAGDGEGDSDGDGDGGGDGDGDGGDD